MSRWFYLNGEFVKEDKAVLPVTQTGIQRAYGIFDLFRTVDQQPRFLNDYLDRFERSQKFLNLTRIIGRDEIVTAVRELQNLNQYKHSTFKLVLLGDGTDAINTLFEPFFYIINTPINPETFPSHVGVISCEYLREFPEVKSLNYMNSFALHPKKREMQAGEVLYHFNGQVSEASRSNVFAIKEGKLITPASNVLQGITRLHVLKLAREIMPVEVGSLRFSDLLTADELFLTSTMKDITPVSFIDEKQWDNPGPFTTKLQSAFKTYVSEQLQA